MFTQTAPPGFGSVAGTPAANASGARLEEEFQRVYSNTGELDERTKNQFTDGTKTDFTGKITGTEVAVNTVSVTSGGKIQHDGKGVFGYTDDATPIATYRHKISGTLDGNGDIFTAHGLTDRTKITGIVFKVDDGVFSVFLHTGSDYILKVDDTSFSAISTGTTFANKNFEAWFVYIL